MRPPDFPTESELAEFARQHMRDEFAIAILPALIVANAILFSVNRGDLADPPVTEAYRLADEALRVRDEKPR